MTSTVLPGVDVRDDRADPCDGEAEWSSPCPLLGSVGMRVETLTVSHGAAHATVMRLAGHLDLASRAAMNRCLASVFAKERQNVVVDLSAVTFCAVGELEMLAAPAPAREQPAVGYAVGARSAVVERVAALVWCPAAAPRYPTTERAVDAALRGELVAHGALSRELRYAGAPVRD